MSFGIFDFIFIFALWVTNTIKFYKIAFLGKHIFFYWWEMYEMKLEYYGKSISWKYFMFYEMTLKLCFMKCSERKIWQCILALI